MQEESSCFNDSSIQTDCLITIQKPQLNNTVDYLNSIKNNIRMTNNIVKQTTEDLIKEVSSKVIKTSEISPLKKVAFIREKEKLNESVGDILKLTKEGNKDNIKELLKNKESKPWKLSLRKTDTNRAKSLSNSPKKDLFSMENGNQFEKHQGNTKEFINKMRELRNERKIKETKRLKVMLENSKRIVEDGEIKHEQKKIELRSKIKEKFESSYLSSKAKREKETKLLKNRPYKIPMPSDYLYKRFEEKYNIEIAIPNLEKNNKELMTHKSKYKPINWDEIRQHQEEFERKEREHSEEKIKRLNELKLQEKHYYQLHRHYQTSISAKCALMDLSVKKEIERKNKWRRELAEKQHNYSAIIKSVVEVKTSPKKIVELKNAISRLKQPVRQCRDNKHMYDLAVINNRPKHTKCKSLINSYSKNTKKLQKQQIDNKVNILRDKKYTDYLKEQRNKKKDSDVLLKRIDWGKIIGDTKLNLETVIMKKANNIDEKVKIKEAMLKAKGGPSSDPNMNENITNMIIESIRAKLAILDKI